MADNPPSDASASRALGFVAIGAAAALWAAAALVASALFDAGVPPLQLAAARAVVATLVLALLPIAWRRPDRSLRGAVIALGLALALVNAAYYVAIAHLEVAVAVVIQYAAPALVVAWKTLIVRELPSRVTIAALVASVTGVVLISEVGASQLRTVSFLGLAAAGASAVLFATYTLVSERAGAVYGPVAALFRGFAVASVFWLAYHAPSGLPDQLLRGNTFPRSSSLGSQAP